MSAPESLRDELAAVLDRIIVDHPMWIDDTGAPLDYLPEREGRIADFVNEATDALLASPALADLIREKQAEAVEAVARQWQTGGWTALTTPPSHGAIPAIAYGQRVTDWLRDRTDQVEGGA